MKKAPTTINTVLIVDIRVLKMSEERKRKGTKVLAGERNFYRRGWLGTTQAVFRCSDSAGVGL